MARIELVPAAAAVLLLAGPAWAHSGTGLPGGFAAGFAHPFGGFDHLLAMVAVGLWGAILGALAFLSLQELLSRLTDHGNLILGPLLVLIALIGRGGLAGLVARTAAGSAR